MKQPLVLPVALALLLTQCHKSDPDPASQLPPETQTGANTFGCLVNGQAWIPKGNSGFSSYQIDFDPTYQGGTLILHTYRDDGLTFQTIIVGGVNINHLGKYIFGSSSCSAEFSDNGRPIGCQEYSSYQNATCKGFFTVTRMDRGAGIVSGIFEFTIAKIGCDTVKVTQGRFDKHL